MWTRSTRMFLLAVFAAVKVQSAREEAELCPRQDPPSGVLVLNLGSNVVLGCRGDVTVDDVPLTSARVMNKKYTKKQREDITASWTSQRHENLSTQLTSMKGDAPTATYQNIDSGLYSKTKVGTTVTVKPSITTRKEQSTSLRVLRAVSQTPGEKETFGITQWSDFDEDDYEDYDYEEERSRVTRGIKKRTRWTLNGRQVRAGVERGGILRRPHLSRGDAGNYSCYRGDRLISTFRISVGAPPESPSVFCNMKSHTSKIRCDWMSKQPVIPRPLCYLLLNRRFLENTIYVNCSFFRSRCWCAFFVKEHDLRDLHRAQLCVSNIAGSAMSPVLNFHPQNTIRPDPPSRVLVSAVEGLKHMLKVSWSYPSSWKRNIFYVLQFHLRYRPQLSEQYQSVMIHDKMERLLSWMIYDALPDTVYEVQLKAKDEFDGTWSDWTEPVFAVTWSAPETTTATENITFEPYKVFYEGSGGSGEEPGVGVVVVAGHADIEYATGWLYVSCAFGLCFFVITVLTIYLLRNRTHLMTRIGKQTLPFTFLLHSSRPLPAPAASEQLPEEGKSLMSPPKHNQQHILPVQQEKQEAIHLHNIDYFLSPGAEGVPLTINRNE